MRNYILQWSMWEGLAHYGERQALGRWPWVVGKGKKAERGMDWQPVSSTPEFLPWVSLSNRLVPGNVKWGKLFPPQVRGHDERIFLVFIGYLCFILWKLSPSSLLIENIRCFLLWDACICACARVLTCALSRSISLALKKNPQGCKSQQVPGEGQWRGKWGKDVTWIKTIESKHMVEVTVAGGHIRAETE